MQPTIQLNLQYQTPKLWAQQIVANTTSINTFLSDHASAEKKASGMAMSMISHYPDKLAIVKALTEVAVEELQHYRSVINLMLQRQAPLLPDVKDHYVELLRQQMRRVNTVKEYDCYLMDRLLVAAVIEKRGAERFQLIADHVTGQLQAFYQAIADSEQKHYQLFLNLASLYFSNALLQQRLDDLVVEENNILRQIPFKLTLH